MARKPICIHIWTRRMSDNRLHMNCCGLLFSFILAREIGLLQQIYHTCVFYYLFIFISIIIYLFIFLGGVGWGGGGKLRLVELNAIIYLYPLTQCSINHNERIDVTSCCCSVLYFSAGDFGVRNHNRHNLCFCIRALSIIRYLCFVLYLRDNIKWILLASGSARVIGFQRRTRVWLPHYGVARALH